MKFIEKIRLCHTRGKLDTTATPWRPPERVALWMPGAYAYVCTDTAFCTRLGRSCPSSLEGVKARELKRLLRTMGWWDTGKGSRHEKLSNGTHSIAIPRHVEITAGTVRAIVKEAETYGRSEKAK